MRVAKRGVGDQQALFLARPRGELFRSDLLQQLPRAGGRRDAAHARQDRWLQAFWNLLSFDLRVAVENYVAQVREQLSGAVAAGGDAKKFGRLVEKRSGDFAGAETRMIDDILQKRNVGLDAANAKLAQRTIHALASFRKVQSPGGHFHEQRIIIGREQRAGVRRAAVEANAKSRGRAVRGNFSVVRREILLGVLGGHAAL